MDIKNIYIGPESIESNISCYTTYYMYNKSCCTTTTTITGTSTVKALFDNFKGNCNSSNDNSNGDNKRDAKKCSVLQAQ